VSESTRVNDSFSERESSWQGRTSGNFQLKILKLQPIHEN